MKEMYEFIQHQNLTNLQAMKNAGFLLKILYFGDWKLLEEFTLPLVGFHFVKLYKKVGSDLKLDALGIYKRATNW